jgi:hypothetical protein
VVLKPGNQNSIKAYAVLPMIDSMVKPKKHKVSFSENLVNIHYYESENQSSSAASSSGIGKFKLIRIKFLIEYKRFDTGEATSAYNFQLLCPLETAPWTPPQRKEAHFVVYTYSCSSFIAKYCILFNETDRGGFARTS